MEKSNNVSIINFPIFSHEESVKIAKRFTRKCPFDKEYQQRLAHELNLIINKKFTDQLLLVCDILDMTTDIPHITRGSAGSSLVCYLLGISNFDPIKTEISFARFLNEFRDTMPDI